MRRSISYSEQINRWAPRLLEEIQRLLNMSDCGQFLDEQGADGLCPRFPLGLVGTLAAKGKLPRFLNWD